MLDPALIVTVEPDALTLTALALNKELSLIKKFPKLKDVGLDIAVLSSKTAICLYSKPICPVPVVGDTLTKSVLSCL